MTQEQFALLPESHQIDIITENAVQVSDHTLGAFTYCLFQLYSFYVEIRFYVKDMSVGGIRCLPLSEIPEPYLLQIDISSLLK